MCPRSFLLTVSLQFEAFNFSRVFSALEGHEISVAVRTNLPIGEFHDVSAH
jgi:hypothetical protein